MHFIVSADQWHLQQTHHSVPVPETMARLAGDTWWGSALAGREEFPFPSLPASPSAVSQSTKPFPAHPSPPPPAHAGEGPQPTAPQPWSRTPPPPSNAHPRHPRSPPQLSPAGTHAGGPVTGTDALGVQLPADLPGEEGGLLQLQLGDPGHHLRGGHAGLATPDGPGLHDPRPVVVTQDLADAAVGYLWMERLGQGLSGKRIWRRRRPPAPPRLWRTLRLREMSEVRTPHAASSMILFLLQVGRGRPFTKRPPSWFTPLGPGERPGSW